MKRLALLTLLFAPMLLVAAMYGCSGSNSTNSQLVAGDTLSPAFQYVADSLDLADQMTQYVKGAIDLTFQLWDSIPTAPAMPRRYYPSLATQSDSLIIVSWNYTYAAAYGWHIFNFAARVDGAADTLDFAGIDSVRFLVDGSPVQHPDSSVTALNIRPHFTVSARVNGSSVSSDQALSMTNLTPDLLTPVTINGSSADTASLMMADSTGSCTLDLSSNLAITNVVWVLGSDACPTSGHMIQSSTIGLSCTGDSTNSININGRWTIGLTFNGDTETLVYTNATTRWVVTRTCGSGPAAAPSPWMLPIEK